MNLKPILLTALCFLSTLAIAQTETLDILSFTAPAGYERKEVKGGVQFSRRATDGPGYCIITLNVSRSATADAQQDFKNEWNELVKPSHHVDVPAEPQSFPPNDGWSVVYGIALVKSDKGPYVASLMTITGHTRVTSIVMLTQTEDFNGDLDTFLRTVLPLTNVAEGAMHPSR